MTDLIRNSIRNIPDFPKPGIVFKDITTLLSDSQRLKETINLLVNRYENQRIDYIAGIEARGFIFGAPLAVALNAGFVPVRKKGKLPSKTLQQCYALEYGKDCIEIHADSFKPGDRVLLIDDLIATGGTAEATFKLIQKTGAKVVEAAFIIDLTNLNGRKKLSAIGCKSFALVECNDA